METINWPCFRCLQQQLLHLFLTFFEAFQPESSVWQGVVLLARNVDQMFALSREREERLRLTFL